MSISIDKLQKRRVELQSKLDRMLLRKATLNDSLDAVAAELEAVTHEIALASIFRSNVRLYRPRQEKDMPITKRLHDALATQVISVRRRFFRLDDDQQAIVEKEFRRHAMACLKAGIATEERFLPELIDDVEKGFYDAEYETIKEAA